MDFLRNAERIIEGKAGKDVLKQTLLDGPWIFAETYSGLVPDKESLIY